MLLRLRLHFCTRQARQQNVSTKLEPQARPTSRKIKTRLTLGAALGAAPRSSRLIRQVCRWHVSRRRGGRVVFYLDHRDLGPLRHPLGQGPESETKTRSESTRKIKTKSKKLKKYKYLLLFLFVGAEGGEVKLRLVRFRARSRRRRLPRALGGLRGWGLRRPSLRWRRGPRSRRSDRFAPGGSPSAWRWCAGRLRRGLARSGGARRPTSRLLSGCLRPCRCSRLAEALQRFSFGTCPMRGVLRGRGGVVVKP